MVCAGRNCVYAFLIVCFFCTQGSIAAFAKEGKNLNPENSNGPAGRDQFQWNEHKRLSWADFEGAVNAATDESAAATHCGIGFRALNTGPGGKPDIVVYNTFYTKRSWVRPDAKLPSILVHEQGHFDLCEIYTRRLRTRMANFDFNIPNAMQALMNIYQQVNNEYETRQQAYETETTHGTNTAQQKKWVEAIAGELM